MTKSNLDIAREILAAAQSDIRGTRGESYFTTDRGITLTPWPACLRFASKLTHPCEQSFPALVVEATDARTGQAPGSIQRIFLGWKRGKAQVDKPKMALGPMKGAVARLGEPIDGQPLLIAEGVENAATGMAASGLAAWATFGTAGLQGFNPPDTVKWVIALAENDEANAKALAVLAPALAERGIRLDVVKPPSEIKDVNDLVNGTSGHTPEAGLAVVRALIEKAQASAASAASATGSPTVSGDSDDDEAGKFSLTESGLYRRKGKKWQWLAQPFEVLGLARDDQDGDWGKLVRFRNPDGRVREEIIKTATLHDDPNAVISALAGHGMDIKCTAVARRSFAEYLAAVDAKERVTTARRIGWLEVGGRRVFVLPDEIIGGGADERIILAEGIGAPYGRRGTLEDWRNAIATPAGEHLMLRLSLSTALAGPLLLLGGFESGVVHVHGSSTIGKTTALRTGASVWGSGVDGEYVRTWRSTANALEATLASACDTFLPLDEIGQADGREIGLALYMAASGSGKSRLRRDASLRPSHKWRTLILSSGETPIEARLNEERRGPARAYAGHLVRAVDIKVERALGVFDRRLCRFRSEGVRRSDEARRFDRLWNGRARVRAPADRAPDKRRARAFARRRFCRECARGRCGLAWTGGPGRRALWADRCSRRAGARIWPRRLGARASRPRTDSNCFAPGWRHAAARLRRKSGRSSPR